MSKPFNFTRTDLEHWLNVSVCYAFGLGLVLIGSHFASADFGTFSAGMAVIGGILIDGGRRFLTDTTPQLPPSVPPTKDETDLGL